MKKTILPIIVLIFPFFLILSGCAIAPPKYKSIPIIQTCSNECYEASIKGISGYGGYEAFMLSIKNKTGKDLELDWNRTLYISHGRTNGGFMFEGVVYKDRNNPKPPDIIFSDVIFSKAIWPNNLVFFSTSKYGGGWHHRGMGAGEHGVFLSIKVDGEEVREKMIIEFVPQQ